MSITSSKAQLFLNINDSSEEDTKKTKKQTNHDTQSMNFIHSYDSAKTKRSAVLYIPFIVSYRGFCVARLDRFAKNMPFYWWYCFAMCERVCVCVCVSKCEYFHSHFCARSCERARSLAHYFVFISM